MPAHRGAATLTQQELRASLSSSEHLPTLTEVQQALIAEAHRLGLKVIAEGIETEAQLALLKQAGCDYGQGFLFSAALQAQGFELLLMADRAGEAGWRGLF